MSDTQVGYAGARLSYRTALGTPSEMVAWNSEQLAKAEDENARIMDSLESLKAKNELLVQENKAVKKVNSQLRDMVETRVPYVATPPAPLPAQPFAAPGPLMHWDHGYYPGWHCSDGVSAAMRIKSGFVERGVVPIAPSASLAETADGEGVTHYGQLLSQEGMAKHKEFLDQRDQLFKEQMEQMGDKWPAASWARFGHYLGGYGRPFLTAEQVKEHEALQEKHEAAMKEEMKELGDKWPGYSWAHLGFPGWWHGANWNTSYAKYYQDSLSAHAEFEHKRYLEKREEMIAAAEEKQQELLRKEAELTAAEEEHEQFLLERRQLLQESENVHRRKTLQHYPSEYMYGFAHHVPRGQKHEYEHALLNKHRLDRYRRNYLEDLQMLEEYHKMAKADYGAISD
eukprot:TRINITY_DN11674_c0_g1_i2.p1 TRINITY_DN11674_c0_g1~~TRINITY_DN11674_c0_g1_i2.p1  ORF type:complete len:398 (+),score=117.37 TRINITY_DN11674_c0_g1_i2:204-1397(+)